MQHGASGRFGSSDHQQAGLALLGQRHRSLQLRPVAARGRAPPTCPGANRLTLHVLAAAAEHERHMIGERTRPPLAAAKARGVKLGNPEQAKINRAKAAARARALHQGWPRIEQCHRNRSQRARHRDTEWRRMVSGAGASRSSRPMIDPGGSKLGRGRFARGPAAPTSHTVCESFKLSIIIDSYRVGRARRCCDPWRSLGET